jgi:hypothetical protein
VRPGCRCSQAALCDDCLEADYKWKAGVAMLRGELWADRVIAAGRDRARPWWAHEGVAAELAHRHVRELGRDPRLLSRLAAACAAQAARRWGKQF